MCEPVSSNAFTNKKDKDKNEKTKKSLIYLDLLPLNKLKIREIGFRINTQKNDDCIYKSY